MPTLDEQFEEWCKPFPGWRKQQRRAFLAGAAAEREAALAIVASIQTDPDGACAEIIRRIRQRGEEGK
jgi:hypothetical protein